jgi:hypothetical protein
MKKLIFLAWTLPCLFIACDSQRSGKTDTANSSIKLPYEPAYSADINDNVSDSDLLLVLNTYKYWESGDMQALRSAMGDSVAVNESEGLAFNGPADSLMKIWTAARDSLASISITMDVWRKNHFNRDSANYITVWYKEVDTHKSGLVDSANYADVNLVRNGKLAWYSQYKQKFKK